MSSTISTIENDTTGPNAVLQPTEEITTIRLPSYEEATTTRDVARLPSYRRTRPSSRFHPYRYNVPVLVDGTGMSRLFNTIYDEEYVRIHVPPAPLRPRPTQPLVATILQANLNDTGANNQYIPNNAPQPDLEEFDRRAQNVAAVILQEFVAGLIRAREA